MTSSAYNGTPAQPQPRTSGITQWGQLGEILGGVKFPEQTARSGFAAAQAWGLANNTGKQNSKSMKTRSRGDRSAQNQGGPRLICVRSSAGQSARLCLWRPRVQAPPGVPVIGQETRTTMKTQNANIDFCGIVNLLQYLVAHGHFSKKEAQKISERIAEKLGADIILNI